MQALICCGAALRDLQPGGTPPGIDSGTALYAERSVAEVTDLCSVRGKGPEPDRRAVCSRQQ